MGSRPGARATPGTGTAQGGAVAVVTGAANGIGLVTARMLRDRGYRVVFADLDESAAARAAAEADPSGATTLPVRVDVRDTGSVDRMVESAVDRFGRLDVLVNNAGVPAAHPSESISDGDWAVLIDVNLSGTLRCCRAAHPALAASPAPAIVNMGSVAGFTGMPGRAGYGAAKAGVAGLTRVLAVEWAPAGIRVNAVAPGYVRTSGFDRRMGPDAAERLAAEVPLGRMCRPEEVATTVCFLASPEAGYITGQSIVVDGGMSIRARS